MTVTARPTPNPDALKFEVTGATLTDQRLLAFQSAREAEGSPLATALFAVRGVASLLIVPTWVAVTKQRAAGWTPLAEAIEQVLLDHMSAE